MNGGVPPTFGTDGPCRIIQVPVLGDNAWTQVNHNNAEYFYLTKNQIANRNLTCNASPPILKFSLNLDPLKTVIQLTDATWHNETKAGITVIHQSQHRTLWDSIQKEFLNPVDINTGLLTYQFPITFADGKNIPQPLNPQSYWDCLPSLSNNAARDLRMKWFFLSWLRYDSLQMFSLSLLCINMLFRDNILQCCLPELPGFLDRASSTWPIQLDRIELPPMGSTDDKMIQWLTQHPDTFTIRLSPHRPGWLDAIGWIGVNEEKQEDAAPKIRMEFVYHSFCFLDIFPDPKTWFQWYYVYTVTNQQRKLVALSLMAPITTYLHAQLPPKHRKRLLCLSPPQFLNIVDPDKDIVVDGMVTIQDIWSNESSVLKMPFLQNAWQIPKLPELVQFYDQYFDRIGFDLDQVCQSGFYASVDEYLNPSCSQMQQWMIKTAPNMNASAQIQMYFDYLSFVFEDSFWDCANDPATIEFRKWWILQWTPEIYRYVLRRQPDLYEALPVARQLPAIFKYILTWMTRSTCFLPFVTDDLANFMLRQIKAEDTGCVLRLSSTYIGAFQLQTHKRSPRYRQLPWMQEYEELHLSISGWLSWFVTNLQDLKPDDDANTFHRLDWLIHKYLFEQYHIVTVHGGYALKYLWLQGCNPQGLHPMLAQMLQQTPAEYANSFRDQNDTSFEPWKRAFLKVNSSFVPTMIPWEIGCDPAQPLYSFLHFQRAQRDQRCSLENNSNPNYWLLQPLVNRDALHELQKRMNQQLELLTKRRADTTALTWQLQLVYQWTRAWDRSLQLMSCSPSPLPEVPYVKYGYQGHRNLTRILYWLGADAISFADRAWFRSENNDQKDAPLQGWKQWLSSMDQWRRRSVQGPIEAGWWLRWTLLLFLNDPSMHWLALPAQQKRMALAAAPHAIVSLDPHTPGAFQVRYAKDAYYDGMIPRTRDGSLDLEQIPSITIHVDDLVEWIGWQHVGAIPLPLMLRVFLKVKLDTVPWYNTTLVTSQQKLAHQRIATSTSTSSLFSYVAWLISLINFDHPIPVYHAQSLLLTVIWIQENNSSDVLTPEQLQRLLDERRMLVSGASGRNRWNELKQRFSRLTIPEKTFATGLATSALAGLKYLGLFTAKFWLPIAVPVLLYRLSQREEAPDQPINHTYVPKFEELLDTQNDIYGTKLIQDMRKLNDAMRNCFITYLQFLTYERSQRDAVPIPESLVTKLRQKDDVRDATCPQCDDKERNDWNEAPEITRTFTRQMRIENQMNTFLSPASFVYPLLGQGYYGPIINNRKTGSVTLSSSFYPESDLSMGVRLQDLDRVKLMLETWISNNMPLPTKWMELAVQMQLVKPISNSAVVNTTPTIPASEVAKLPPVREWPSNQDLTGNSSQEDRDRAAMFGPFNGQYTMPDVRSAWVNLNAESQACPPGAGSPYLYPAFQIVPGGYLKPMCGREAWMSDEAMKTLTQNIKAVMQKDPSDKELIYWLQQTLEAWCPEPAHVVRVWFWLGLTCLSREVMADFATGVLQAQREKNRNKVADALKQQASEIEQKQGSSPETKDQNRIKCFRRLVFLYQSMPSLMVFPFVPNETVAMKMAAQVPGLVLAMLDWSQPGRIRCVQVNPVTMTTTMKAVMIDDFYDDLVQHPVSSLRLWVFRNFAGGILANMLPFRNIDFKRRSAKLVKCKWTRDTAGFYSIRFLLPWSEQTWFDQTLQRLQASNGTDETSKAIMMRFWQEAVAKQVEGFTETQQILLQSLIELEQKRWVVPKSGVTGGKTVERLKTPQEVFQKAKQLFSWQGSVVTRESIQTMIDLALCQNPSTKPEVVEYMRNRVRELQIHPNPETLTRSELCSLLMQADVHKSVQVDTPIPLWWDLQPVPSHLAKEIKNQTNVKLLDIFTTQQNKQQEIKQYLLSQFGVTLESVQQMNQQWSKLPDEKLIEELKPLLQAMEQSATKQEADGKVIQQSLDKLRKVMYEWLETTEDKRKELKFGQDMGKELTGDSPVIDIMSFMMKQMWHPLAKLKSSEQRFMEDMQLLLKNMHAWMALPVPPSTNVASGWRQQRMAMLRNWFEFNRIHGDHTILQMNLTQMFKSQVVLQWMYRVFYTKFGDPGFIPDWQKLIVAVRQDPKRVTILSNLMMLHLLLRHNITHFTNSWQQMIHRTMMQFSVQIANASNNGTR